MSTLAFLTYVSVILVFSIYLIYKWKKRGYLFSCFNINLFIYFFTILITPIFYNSQEAWAALGVHDNTAYIEYLNMSLSMNSIGFCITIAIISLVEFKGVYRSNNIIYRASSKLNSSIIDLFFWGFLFLWYVIVLIYNKGLPLLNGGRTFYLNTSISPIYLALNNLILLYALYYGTRFIYKHSCLFKWILCILTVAFSGNRGSLLLSALAPMALLFIYVRVKEKYSNNKNNNSRKWQIKSLCLVALMLFLVMICGLIMQAIRSGGDINLISMIKEILYGNTFCDIRDGAYILKGFNDTFENEFIMGKTYFAGAISFLPSSMSPFRQEWSWGSFSTTALFGWTGHTGLRGGAVMEAFLNFGVVGILLSSIIQGLIYGYIEKNFYKIFFLSNVKNGGKEYLILNLFVALCDISICTAGMHNIYVDILFLFLILLFSSISLKANTKRQIGSKQITSISKY